MLLHLKSHTLYIHVQYLISYIKIQIKFMLACHTQQYITNHISWTENYCMKTDQNLSLNDILDPHINIIPQENIIQSQCLIVQPMRLDSAHATFHTLYSLQCGWPYSVDDWFFEGVPVCVYSFFEVACHLLTDSQNLPWYILKYGS